MQFFCLSYTFYLSTFQTEKNMLRNPLLFRETYAYSYHVYYLQMAKLHRLRYHNNSGKQKTTLSALSPRFLYADFIEYFVNIFYYKNFLQYIFIKYIIQNKMIYIMITTYLFKQNVILNSTLRKCEMVFIRM